MVKMKTPEVCTAAKHRRLVLLLFMSHTNWQLRSLRQAYS